VQVLKGLVAEVTGIVSSKGQVVQGTHTKEGKRLETGMSHR
jgi:hypothetical protein